MSRGSIARAGLALAGMAALMVAAVTPSATARTTTAQQTAATCTLDIGSVTASGEHTARRVTAGTPSTVKDVPNRPSPGAAVYTPGTVRLSSTFVNEPEQGLFWGIGGWVVQGDVLSFSRYDLRWAPYGGFMNPPELIRIGSGWTNFKLVEESEYLPVEHGRVLRTSAYGLRNDGVLFRWRLDGLVWHRSGMASGFASVKTMTLISKTATYDTFLANTRGGALYTIRIPTASPMKPIVKPVRTSTWQVFETLAAAKCGNSGSVLLGIDKNTHSGYLYAVGHANGQATVIKGFGKVQGTFSDPVDFRWRYEFDPLNGD